MSAKTFATPIISMGTMVAGIEFARQAPDWAKPWLLPWDEWALVTLVREFDLPFFAVIVFATGMIVLVEWAVRKLAQRARPYFGVPMVRPEPIYLESGKIYDTVWLVSVPLFNNPRWRSEGAIMMKAHATLDFVDFDSGKFLRRTGGRWADNLAAGHPDAPSNVSDLRFRDIYPNDSSCLINIVAKSPKSDYAYAMTEEGWLLQERGSRILRSNNLLVTISIKSSTTADFQREFLIRCAGKGVKPSVEVRETKWYGLTKSAWRPLEA